MSQPKKRKNKKNYHHREEYSTYDPKIHIRTGSGYHMKRNAPKPDLSGKQLANILGIKE